MDVEKMAPMSVTQMSSQISSGAELDRRLVQTIEARRRLRRRPRGRAWINGREVGGPDPRFSHLAVTHD